MSDIGEPFQALTEAMVEWVHLRARSGERVWVNAAFERATGLGVGSHDDERFALAEDRHAFDEAEQRLVGGSTEVTIDHRRRDEEGRVHGVRSRVRRTVWHGAPVLLVVSSDSHRDHDPVCVAPMVERFHDILVVMDADGTERFVSPACERILGFRPDELVGKNALSFLHPEDAPRVLALMVEAASGSRESAVIEFRHAHRDGSWRWLEASGTNMLSDPALRALVMTARDVTARRLAEEHRAALEDGLHRAQRMESVGRLAGGVAHDFNNQLTVVRGNIALALDELEPEDAVRELLEDASAAAGAVAELTRQLLAFSRKQLLVPRVLDPGDALVSLCGMLATFADERVEVRRKIDAGLWHVKVDPQQLQQILLSLALSARDAMPRGGVLTVEACNLRLEASDAEARGLRAGDHVRVLVRDNGVGMDETARARVFEPFASAVGDGFGLASAHGAAEQSGGHLEVDSSPEAGTTYQLLLPRALGLTEDAVASARPAGDAWIAIVEEDRHVRALAVRLLEREGYRVRSFENGTAALHAYASRDERVDVLVTDERLPGMVGRKLSEQLRALFPELRVLFTSSYAADGAGHLETTDGILRKPYSAAALCERVRGALHQTR